MKFSKIFILLSLLVIVSCSSKQDDEKAKQNQPIDKLYNDAMSKLNDTDYKGAIEGFEETQRLYPYSEWAVRAEIMSAYANYKAGKYENAISISERFAKQHPTNINTPYAFYLKALCYYDQITDVGRDQRITEEARKALGELVRRFPDSDYSRDAKIKLDLVSDHLAGKEMEIGRYYENHEEYLAAINRFRSVVEQYQTTSHTPEALHRLVECYLKLGIGEQAKKYASVLGYNYPQSYWYKASYALMNGESLPQSSKEKSSLINKILPF